MKKKDGRPPRSISAWRSLHARDELEARFPEVAALVEMLGQNVDLAEIEAALAAALASLQASRGRSNERLPATATVEQRLLHAAAEVERLSQDRHALSRLSSAIAAELDLASSDLARAETRLRRVGLERPPLDGYEAAVAGKLRAAGLTERIAREINAKHVERIKMALDGADEVDPAVRRRPTREKAEVALAWTPDNAWADLLRDTPHHKLDSRPMTTGAVDVVTLRRCGLPPFNDLAEFGYPYLLGAFEAATDARTKARECWTICSKWIADHISDIVGAQDAAAMRKDAWTFLFGIRYDFAHEIRKLDRVTFPSPWDPDRYIVAQPRNERA